MIDTSFDELLNGYINNLLTREELAHFLQLLQNEEYATRFKNSIEPLFGDNSFSALADQNKACTKKNMITENAKPSVWA